MAGIEIRSSADGDTWTLEGLASTWAAYRVNERGQSYSERFTPGAFSRATSGQEVAELRVEHVQAGAPLAASGRSGTLQLRESEAGLHLTASLPKDDPDCVAAVSKAKRGILDRFSIGFIPEREDWSSDGTTRTIRSARLPEVSLVHQPMNSGAAMTSIRAAHGEGQLEHRSLVPVVFVEDGALSRAGKVGLPEISDAQDLIRAVKAVDGGGLSDDAKQAVRYHLIAWARGHNAIALIPSSWAPDGTLRSRRVDLIPARYDEYLAELAVIDQR